MARNLTQGEIALAKQVYGDSLNYGTIFIHQGKYPLSIWLQSSDTIMAPNGEIYADGNSYRDDYSLGSSIYAQVNKATFIHELMHVWQYQNKVYGDLRGRAFYELITHSFDYSSTYSFMLDKNKDLLDYNMEQQASIMEMYYLLRFNKEDWNVRILRESQWYKDKILNEQTNFFVMTLFRSVMYNFMRNPSYAKQNYSFF